MWSRLSNDKLFTGHGAGTATKMTQFGNELRLERERCGISLEILSSRTKLSVRQLMEVEDGNFEALPGGIFRKGFVRSYLRALSIDETAWLERFDALYEESGLRNEQEETEWVAFAENVKSHRTAPERKPTALRWLGALGLATVVLLLAWCVWALVLKPRVETRSRNTLAAPSESYFLPATSNPGTE